MIIGTNTIVTTIKMTVSGTKIVNTEENVPWRIVLVNSIDAIANMDGEASHVNVHVPFHVKITVPVDRP